MQELNPAQIPSGLYGVNSRGLGAGGIFTPHFERSEIVAGPPAGPREFRSDINQKVPQIGKSKNSLAEFFDFY